jgi:hypothetical protein
VAIVHPPTQEHNVEVSNCAGEPRHPRFNNSSPMRIAITFKLKAAQFITSLRRIAKQERKGWRLRCRQPMLTDLTGTRKASLTGG